MSQSQLMGLAFLLKELLSTSQKQVVFAGFTDRPVRLFFPDTIQDTALCKILGPS